MDDILLQRDIAAAEALDQELHDVDEQLEDVQGSLAAVTEDIPVQQLSDKQQASLTAYQDLTKDQKGSVYAVADKEALEGFLDVTAGIARKAMAAYSGLVTDKFKVSSKALLHYVALGQKLKARLEELKPLLEKRDLPLVDVFEYGAFSRFFQCNGKGIGSFTQFQIAVNVQVVATKYVFTAGPAYSDIIAQKLLTDLQELQATRQPEPDRIVALRDSIERYWLQTWHHADLTPAHGETPQSALQAIPSAKFTSLAPLLDNRYLVVHQPKNNGGKDASKIATAIKDYGVLLVFDKKPVDHPQKFMNIPDSRDLLGMVNQVINQLSDFKLIEQLVKQNDKVAKELQRAASILVKQLPNEGDKQYFGFISEYTKLLGSVSNITQEPYTQMCWMFIRTAMIVITLVELSVLEDPSKQIVAKRFLTKQNEEFTNVATESYTATQKALKAAASAVTSK